MLRTQMSSLVMALIAFVAVPNRAAYSAFWGVSVDFHTSIETPSGPKDVYRLYAHFTQGDDRVFAWGGLPIIGTTEFSTGPCDKLPFYEGFGLTTSPSQALIDLVPLTQWETFATIGVSISDQGVPSDQTTLSPGFPAFIQGDHLLLTEAVVWAPMTAPQARADFAGDGDSQLRVLLAQFAVEEDQYIFGHITIQWGENDQSPLMTVQGTWNTLEPIGRCCIPTGECVITGHPTCSMSLNGVFLGCDPCDACELTCLPDIAPHPGDGVVNTDDLLAVINSWGDCSPWDTCPADVAPTASGDNVVNVDDLIVVINGWGPCK